MKTKQTIAIIGATGRMGPAIAKSLAGGNYRLLLKADDAGRLASLLGEIRRSHPGAEVEIMTCPREASWEADIIMVALPLQAETEVVERIKEVVNQKIVVSISDLPISDNSSHAMSPVSSAAEALQKILPHSKVVKVVDITGGGDYISPLKYGLQVDYFIAGNEPEALEAVVELLRVAGYNTPIAANQTLGEDSTAWNPGLSNGK
jgi:predicted dinucleotide-binding enzyme